MFDKLVVSTAQRRRGRTAKFFFGTVVVYLSVVVFAFAASILFSTPRLADTSAPGVGPIVIPIAGTTQKREYMQETTVAPKDPRNVEPLETIITNLGTSRQPVVQNTRPPGTGDFGGADVPGDSRPGIPGMPDSTGRDVSSANALSEPPRPDPPHPQPRVDTAKPLPVSSTVLQGKAIERVVPVYPELPKRIRLQGEVSVEVIISPEGRVESVRVVDGHPMLVNSAREAARGWRFEPTFLNGVAVRVTGVITFVFKMTE